MYHFFMEPLSSILRPKSLETFVGQHHLVDEGMPISTFLENKKIPSMLFW
jgi:replication-associated recombination protein RarA